METNISSSAPAIQPSGRTQSSGSKTVSSSRSVGDAASGFAPRTNVNIGNAVNDMAGVLAKVAGNTSSAEEAIPKQLQQIINNIMQSAFAMEESLGNGVGSALASTRFSTEQLTILNRMLEQLATLSAKGQAGAMSDELGALLVNAKNITDKMGLPNGTILNKLAFQLMNDKNLTDLPQALQQILAQLSNMGQGLTQAGQGQGDNFSFLKQMVDAFFPRSMFKGPSNSSNVPQNQAQPQQNQQSFATQGNNTAAQAQSNNNMQSSTTQQGNNAGAQQSSNQSGTTQGNSNNALNNFTNNSANAGNNSTVNNSNANSANNTGSMPNNANAQSNAQANSNGTQQTQTSMQNNSSAQTNANGNNNVMPQGNMNNNQLNNSSTGNNQPMQQAQQNSNQTQTQQSQQSQQAAQGKNNVDDNQLFRNIFTKQMGNAEPGSIASMLQNRMNQRMSQQQTVFQNTTQNMDTMKELAQMLLKDSNMSMKDTQLLRSFINGHNNSLNMQDAKQLNLLLRMIQLNVPAALQQAGQQPGMEELPRLWAFVQLCEMASLKNLKTKDLKTASKNLNSFVSSMKGSMQSSGSYQAEGSKSLNFMIPMFFGDAEKSLPAYIHVFDDDNVPGFDGKKHKETWLRVCVLTDNIGAVEMVCCLYDSKNLSMRVMFTEDTAVKDFNAYLPELRKSFNTTPITLTDIKVGTVGE